MSGRLRKHQAEFSAIVDRIIAGEPIKTIIGHITPGGGKSIFPLLAGRLIRANLADSIAWVVPRLTLAHQAQLNFTDPYFKRMLNHGLTLRAANNKANPCRGQSGYVVTFQSLGVDERGIHAREFQRKRYILIVDEAHHAAADDSCWGKALEPMIEHARFVILLSGTLSRGDGKKIAFLPYIRKADMLVPDFRDTADTAVISYSRSDALREKAILPIKFYLSDGPVAWEDKAGRRRNQMLSTAVLDTGSAIYTALHTEFADQIMREGFGHWDQYRKAHSRSKIVVVTANIEHGRKILKKIKEWGYVVKMATSEDTPAAIRVIKEFRTPKLNVMVAVGMISEGFDCKPLTHIVALTHIRTKEWIDQLVARAVRVDPVAGPYESQTAFVFAPDDFLFRQVVEQIRREQLTAVKDMEGEGRKKQNGENGEPKPKINPLNGEVTNTREIALGGIPDGSMVFDEEPELTIKEQEDELRAQIHRHVAGYAFANYYKPERINAEIKAYWGKPRSEMTLDELRRCFEYIKQAYPLNGNGPSITASPPRGKRQRVPTKAQPWQPPPSS